MSQSSLKRVAELSGFSVSTVSRVLNDPDAQLPVRRQTRERVLEVARQLDYRPNPMLRTIRAKKTNMIAIVGFRDFGAAFRGPSEEAINAFVDIAYGNGYELCTNLLSPKLDPYALPRWRVDGCVVVDCPDPSLLTDLEQAETPYVSINGAAGPSGSCVRADDAHGAEEIVRHLLRLRHRRIAFIAQDPACRARSLKGIPHHSSFFGRHEGYRAALRDSNVEPLTPEPPPAIDAYEAVRRAVVEQGATALIAYDHMTAVRVLHACATLNIQVPSDVSLACFNDMFPCADVVPSITAVSLPGAHMGRLAAEMLLGQIRNPDEAPRTVTCPETVQIRESTAPPRG